MTEAHHYPTARSVEQAIKDAARRASAADDSLSTSERIQMEPRNRFLSRIFSEGKESDWVLKGGTAMLARLPSSRMTVDIDLLRRGITAQQAVADLRRLAEIDLGEHFSFIYSNYASITGGDAQPYADGYKVKFDVFTGTKKMSPIAVDVVVGVGDG